MIKKGYHYGHAQGSFKQVQTGSFDCAFCAGFNNRIAAKLINVNKTTTAYSFRRLREIIALKIEHEAMLCSTRI